ncbi:MAG: hypothetical protein Q4G25_00480 [Paracoccus sp. (in: a-proteobacteria)]|nr:hypothetical protein [Paracoccus sp. (in: a-proteobacteria)]
MFSLDRVMTPAGTAALAAEQRALRLRRAADFLREGFAPRVAHLDDVALQDQTARMLDNAATRGLENPRDQFTAMVPELFWGPGWADDDMPAAMMAAAGNWDQPAPRAQLSRALAGLDIWDRAVRTDLADRHRAASVLHQLYADPRAAAFAGRDPGTWCAAFAPALWSLMPDPARAGHCAAARANAARYLPDVRDHALFACLGLVLGVGFAENPLHPRIRAALAGPAQRAADEIRVTLGQAVVALWQQITEETA